MDERIKLPGEIKHYNPEDLIFYDLNARKHSEEQLIKLQKSFEQFGVQFPILVQKNTNVVIAGHGRVRAAMRKGITSIPAIELDFNEEQVRAYNIADNKLSELAVWDVDRLESEIKELESSLDLSDYFDNEIKIMRAMEESSQRMNAILQEEVEDMAKVEFLMVGGYSLKLPSDLAKEVVQYFLQTSESINLTYEKVFETWLDDMSGLVGAGSG